MSDPKNCASCRHLRRDLIVDQACCGHPERIWQDLVSIEGWPLEHDVTAGVWSECPFRRQEAGERAWSYLVLPNRHVVVFHHSHPTAMEMYQSSALKIIAANAPPMFTSGTFVDGDLAGHTFDLLQ